MDLLENPFYIFIATQRDNQQRIIEIAEQRALLSGDAEACRTARAELTNPRKRIAAEAAWLPGLASEATYNLLMLLELSAGNRVGCDGQPPLAAAGRFAALSYLRSTETDNVADKILESLKRTEGPWTAVNTFLGINTLTPIARANLIAARLLRLPAYTPESVADWILALSEAFERIQPAEVHATLNAERHISGFPEITDTSTIAAEIRARRLHYRQVITSALENLPDAEARVAVVSSVVATYEDRWPTLVVDTVEAYENGAKTFLETAEKNIAAVDRELRSAAETELFEAPLVPIVDELIQALEMWHLLIQPIQLHTNKQGLEDNASEDMAARVRHLAFHLLNEYDKLYFAQQILSRSQEIFSEIPDVAERISSDIERLNRVADQREKEQLFTF